MKSPALTIAVGLAFCTAGAFGETLPPWAASVTPYGRYSFEADFEDGQSLSVLRAGADFTVGGPVSQATFISLAVGTEYSNYDFSIAAAGMPDDVYFVDIRPAVSTYLNENLGIYGGLILTAGAEADAELGDSVAYGAFAGVNYQIAKGVWVGGGVGISTQLEDSPIAVPLVNIDWTINDRLRLEVSGLSGTLTYTIDPQWSVFVEGRYELRQYRLADDAIIAEGVLSDASIPLGVGVRFFANDNITVSLGGGAVVWREIEFFDDDENKISDDTTDITAYVAASVKIAF